MVNKLVYIIVLIVAVLAVGLLLTSQMPVVAGSQQVPIVLTDPQQVPPGTSSLIISYSSVQAHLSNAGNSSGWINASGSGSIDLTVLINVSQIIGIASIPTNASINTIRFSVTEATIAINGTAYNVTVPSGQVTAHVTGKTTVNSTSSVLLDLSPTVVAIVTTNSTVFVMVPSVKAIIVPRGAGALVLNVGARNDLTSEERARLEEGQTALNLTITSALLSVSPDNVTHISITVRDNSNASIIIKHAGIFGNISATFNNATIHAKAQAYVNNTLTHMESRRLCANTMTNSSNEGEGGIGSIIIGKSDGFGLRINNSVRVNTSICTQAGLSLFRQRLDQALVNVSARIESDQVHFKALPFAIASNDTLVVPPNTEEFEASGIIVQPGQSATLSFNGVISLGDGLIRVTLISGVTYKISVQGEEAIAVANVTAT